MTPDVKVNYTETMYTLEDAQEIINAKKARKRKMIKQKMAAVACLLLTAAIPLACDGDITACFLTAPLGIGMLFTKNIYIM